MNKAELISVLAEKANLSKTESKRALDAFMDIVTDTLKAGDKVSLIGFGSFSVVERSARTGVNPITKKPIQIPPTRVVKFKPGAELSYSVK